MCVGKRAKNEYKVKNCNVQSCGEIVMLSPVFDFNLSDVSFRRLVISRKMICVLFVLVMLSAITEVSIKHMNRQDYASLSKDYAVYENLKRESGRLQLLQSKLLAQNVLSKRSAEIDMGLPKKIFRLKSG